MERLVAAFREVIPGVRPVLLLAIAKDKEIDLVLDALGGLPLSVVACRARTKRAAEPQDLVLRLRARGVEAEAFEGSSAEALARARGRAGGGGVVLCAGSLYLAGEALEALGEGVD
jgi:folylpolyglutamate synthase/dihydropteroate synthase